MKKLKDKILGFILHYLLVSYAAFLGLIPLWFGFVWLTGRHPEPIEAFAMTMLAVSWMDMESFKSIKSTSVDTKEV